MSLWIDGLKVDGRTEYRDGQLIIRPVGPLAVEINLNQMKLIKLVKLTNWFNLNNLIL